MKTSVKEELLNSILDKINDGVLTNDNKDEWHYLCFNEDYYIIGYYECNQWLKAHDIDCFEAIEEVINYENDNFGETTTSINSESIVNMLAYIWGEELICSFYADTIEELKEEITEML